MEGSHELWLSSWTTHLTDYADGETLDPDNPPAIDESFRMEVDNLLATSVPALADGDVVDEWDGLRTVTPDGRPIVGESPVEGFHLAVGMSGAGVTLAPAVANLLADTLVGERSVALDRLVPDRF